MTVFRTTGRFRHFRTGLAHILWIAGLICLVGLGLTAHVQAGEPVKISRDDTALDLTGTTEIYNNQGEAFQVSTAPGSDGIVRRIEVRSSSPQHQGDWAVFSLSNVSDVQLERVIVAPHFRLVDSKLFWPDLGAKRIISITPNEGFALDRQPSDEADVFHITLNPGSVITFVVELATPELPQIYLWEPDKYKDTVNAFTLYRGIVLGIAGLLAVFLTILFVVKGTSMLPATAALAWAVLGYVCVDFGFLQDLIRITGGDERIWRACTEVSLAAGLVIFLFTYLHLNRWHQQLGYATFAWIMGLAILYGVAIFDPAIAAGIARLSFALTAAIGIVLIIFLGFNRYDRAILLVPAWALILAWIFGAWLTVTGQINNDIIQPALGGGLVLIVLLIGFTVMQHAFSGGAYHQGLFSDMERQSLALVGSGDTIWDWDVARDRVVTIPDIALQLGLPPGTLHGPARNWLPVLHPDDRDRFRATLDVLLEHRKGKLNHDFRLRADDGQYHWITIRARPVLGANGEIIRCVGTMIDVSEHKNSVERLLHEALHDQLTSLPNRKIFLDRLQASMTLAAEGHAIRPTVLTIDIDRYKAVNEVIGVRNGNNVLVALTRRLRRLLKPQDTLARLGGDEFGLILVSENDPAKVAEFADAISKAIMVPVNHGNRELMLTASIGLATWLTPAQDAQGLLNDAELGMYRAKRLGGNRVEPFQPAFRNFGTDRMQLEADLRRAIERREMSLVYQPIVRLDDAEIAGFEAMLRWDHPKRGLVPADEFIPVAESSNMIHLLGIFVFEQATKDLDDWLHSNGDIPIFVSINMPSAQLINQEFFNDIRFILDKSYFGASRLTLELPETAVMENPEQAHLLMEKMKDLGVNLALDAFGKGNASLDYLTRFPFDMIKIDPSQILDTTERGAILLRSVIAMAKELGMTIVVEGIQSEQDAIKLGEL
ncbi:MAG: hypothetical protein RIR97_1265, partial [Pseudomonadota bacterium]